MKTALYIGAGVVVAYIAFRILSPAKSNLQVSNEALRQDFLQRQRDGAMRVRAEQPATRVAVATDDLSIGEESTPVRARTPGGSAT